MEMKPLIRRVSSIGILLLFIGDGVIPATAIASLPSGTFFSSKTLTTIPRTDSPKGETELKYYAEENINQVVAFDTGGSQNSVKTAIRLTQDEMAPFKNWTFTKVNVAVLSLDECYPGGVDVQIYIYDKGWSPRYPGLLITNDTVFHIDSEGITTIPLVTPIALTSFEEIWVAVEWPSNNHWDSYAFIDTLSGPHVENKSDFVGFNGDWTPLHHSSPDLDGRWGIGAIVEGLGQTELSIENIKGPIGIAADVSNIGNIDPAVIVSWSITISGGLLHKVNVLENGIIPLLPVNSYVIIDTGKFFGFGKITIIISVTAENAFEVSTTKTAFLIGPFVVGIR